MSKLVLFNIIVQLFALYWSFANVTEVSLSKAGQTLGEFIKGETTKESRVTTNVSKIRETTEKTNFIESTTSQSTTKSDLTETTTDSDLTSTRTESDIRGKIKVMLETFCPLVDICDTNSTSTDLIPNGLVSRGRVSCCRGCSCHPDCKERMNCCYPEDNITIDYTDQASSPYRCLYTRLGQDEYIDGTVPAYRTIVAPPLTGCVDSRPLRVTLDVILYPTCDDIDVTPLGPYSPVYSEETGDIYKNILCARCHGVKKTVAFQSILVCEVDKFGSKPWRPMTENLGFLESKALPPKCYVDFKHTNPNDLDGRRCYKDLISTCTAENTTNLLKRLEEDPIHLDFVTIRDLCENGIVAPTLHSKKFYKNIFCAKCAEVSINRTPLLCIDPDLERTFGESITFLLDPKIMHTIEKIHKKKKHRKVCVTHRGTKDEVCKTIRCPSGKIQNAIGKCVNVGKFIDKGRLLVLKLTPGEIIDFSEPENDQETKLLVQSILKNNPWPKDWRVTTIRRRIDQTKCHEKSVAIAYLVPEEKQTEVLLRDVDKFIRLTWALDWKNKTYRLTQSFSDYEMKHLNIGGKITVIPSWQVNYRKENLTAIYLGCGPIEWKTVLMDSRLKTRMVKLNRLFFCNQIELMYEEFTLGADNAYLESNLTNRVLFDMEFDLIEGKDGMHARVCLKNTIFTTTKPNGVRVLVGSVVDLLVPLLFSCIFQL